MEQSPVEGLRFCVVAGEHLSLMIRVGPAPKGNRQGLGWMICESTIPVLAHHSQKGRRLIKTSPKNKPNSPAALSQLLPTLGSFGMTTKTRASTACAHPCFFPCSSWQTELGSQEAAASWCQGQPSLCQQSTVFLGPSSPPSWAVPRSWMAELP